jgi:hypothetical protein
MAAPPKSGRPCNAKGVGEAASIWSASDKKAGEGGSIGDAGSEAPGPVPYYACLINYKEINTLWLTVIRAMLRKPNIYFSFYINMM